jgi:hypothetical protein
MLFAISIRSAWSASNWYLSKYGLLVLPDPRWNNDTLNPAFRSLTMGDFEVVRVAVTALTHEQLRTGRQNRDALTHLEAHNPH